MVDKPEPDSNTHMLSKVFFNFFIYGVRIEMHTGTLC